MRFLTIVCPLFSFIPVVFCNFAILFGRVTRRVFFFMMVYFSVVVVVEEGVQEVKASTFKCFTIL